jgi:hypothetical protein
VPQPDIDARRFRIAADQLAERHSIHDVSRPAKAIRLKGQQSRSQHGKAVPSFSSKPPATALVRTHQNALASNPDFSLGQM